MKAEVARLRAKLLRWYRRAHRDLPWRRTTDAYRIWVSEIMLQQTRVETVIPYYQRFLARFPKVEQLASAPLDDVLTLWSGLGYYRRARLLHQAAALIVREHGGVMPQTLEETHELPGVGRSTAGAISSISYGVRAPVLDGNVQRVLTRLFALQPTRGARIPMARLWVLAQELVECDRPGDVNQALMELGATLCLPYAAARCEECPLRGECKALARGVVARLPPRPKSNATVTQTWAVALARRGERYLVRQRGPTGLLHGLHELPTLELSESDAVDDDRTRRALATFLREQLGVDGTVGEQLVIHRHAISNRRVSERVFEVSVRGRVRAAARWLDTAAIGALPLTTATRKILAHVERASVLTSAPPR